MTALSEWFPPTLHTEPPTGGKPDPTSGAPRPGTMELWEWHEIVRKGNMAAARRSCSVIMYHAEGTPVAKYWLEKAWPSKLDISAMKAGASEVMYETVTLVCEHMQRVAS